MLWSCSVAPEVRAIYDVILGELVFVHPNALYPAKIIKARRDLCFFSSKESTGFLVL